MTNQDQNENFYNHEIVKKYLPKINDEQVKYTGIPVTKHILFCGGTGTGKSNSFLNFLKRTDKSKKPTYTKIFMLIKKLEPFNYALKEILGDRIEFYYNLNDFPSVDTFQDLSKKNNKLYLMVFDDFITDKKVKDKKKLDDYLIYGRAKGCQVCLLSQSYFDTDPLLRKQVSFTLLCGIKGKRELNTILKEYALGDLKTDELKEIYDYAKKVSYVGEPTFLKINCEHCDPNKKFSRNWLQYIKLENESDSE
jgi:hypothetical protein